MYFLILSLVCIIFAGCGLDETLHRSDQPISLEAARKDQFVSSVSFPPSATDIFYLFHAGGMQEHQFLIRFAVAPEELNTAVTAMLADHDKTTREQNRYTTNSVPSMIAPELSQFAPITWWNPNCITNGYRRTCATGPPLDVMVDVPRHTIYVCDTD